MAAAIDLRVTDTAARALRGAMSRIDKFKPVATVVWSVAGSTETPQADGTVSVKAVGPGWDVGFYDSASVPSDKIVVIDGISFYFDQGSTFERLNGATLDYRNGFFAVTNAAI